MNKHPNDIQVEHMMRYDLEQQIIKDTKKRTADRRRPKQNEGEWLWWTLIGIFGFWLGWMIWEGLKTLVI